MKLLHYDSSLLIPYIGKKINAPLRKKDDARIRERAEKFIEACQAPIKISVATFAEILRHFDGQNVAMEELRETVPNAPLQLTQRNAHRWARLQNRSRRVMGDNDAWNAALAIDDNAALVGCDHAFENRPDLDYIDFTKSKFP